MWILLASCVTVFHFCALFLPDSIAFCVTLNRHTQLFLSIRVEQSAYSSNAQWSPSYSDVLTSTFIEDVIDTVLCPLSFILLFGLGQSQPPSLLWTESHPYFEIIANFSYIYRQAFSMRYHYSGIITKYLGSFMA